MTARKTAEKTDEAPEVKAAEVPEVTRLDSDVHAPSTTAPGDGPADTTDPTERASTIMPQAPSPEALAAGTILGAVPVRVDVAQAPGVGEIRVEEYDAVDPHGVTIRVRHILDGPDAGKSFRIE